MGCYFEKRRGRRPNKARRVSKNFIRRVGERVVPSLDPPTKAKKDKVTKLGD